jgi:hypothetical protein
LVAEMPPETAKQPGSGRSQTRGRVLEAAITTLVSGAVGLLDRLREMLSHLNANRVTPEALFDAVRPAAMMIDAFRRK